MSIEKINQGDQLSQSADLVNDNIDKLKMLFPEIVTEGRIDFKALQQVLGEELEEEEEYYRFTWAGKSQARREAHKPSTGTLRPAKEESLDWDTTENMYIEGDNLEVLKLLQKSYAGKIKMIYIDPPYNTGKDFVYKDNYKDNLKNYQEVTGQIDSDGNKISTNSDSDGRYHSNWLNMMYPRLRLARNLLKDDGVIFMSIDEGEVENLKKIGNEIFGESNYVTQVTNITGANQSGEGVKFQKNTEYVLVYSKKYDSDFINRVDKVEETLRNLNDAPSPLDTRPDMGYTIYYNPKNGDFLPKKDYDKKTIHLNEEKLVYQNDLTLISKGYIPIRPGIRNDKLHRWRWGIDTFSDRRDEIVFEPVNKTFKVMFRQKGLNPPKNYMNFAGGTSVLKNLFDGKQVFDYPKGISFLKYLISLGCNEGIVLDFFSGSSSTAHALLDLNKTDREKRNFIQVQLPELTDSKSLAFNEGYKQITEIGKERIRRVVKKIKNENAEKSKELDLGFKVFKLDSSSVKSWDGNPENLKESLFDAVGNIKTDRTEEDVLYEILLKYGLDLTLPIEERIIEGKKVFNVGLGSLFICLADDITAKVAEGIGQWKEACSPEICRVIFKDNGFTDVEKTNSVQTLKRHGINEIRSI